MYHMNSYYSTYAENVFPAGREALTTGKFHDMFMAGDGHELEDYVGKDGRLLPAHAKSYYSSSMLAYNFFFWVSPEHPLSWYGVTYDKVYFEVKFPVMAKSSNGRPINRPSNMDVVLISDDCKTMLCIESKYNEYTHRRAAEFADAYFMSDCYYQGNPFVSTFIRAARNYDQKKHGYFAGIKQNVSHLIGITNIKYDADALAWFRDNNPFIEPEVMQKICCGISENSLNLHFLNLLYIDPMYIDAAYGRYPARFEMYPHLLVDFQQQYCMDLHGILKYSIFTSYVELITEVQNQMPEGLADYLDSRYGLFAKVQYLDAVSLPHFPLPEGYDTPDHYLTDLVLKGANVRYKDVFTPEVTERIKSELKIIRHRGWAERFLFEWDYVREAHEHEFLTSPGYNHSAGSVVLYCLGVTGVEPISTRLSSDGLLKRAILQDYFVEFSTRGKAFVQNYLKEKYGSDAASAIVVNEYSSLNIVEHVFQSSDKEFDFNTLPNDINTFEDFYYDSEWWQYSSFGERDRYELQFCDIPTFKDMVEIFSCRTFDDGSIQVVPREHSYARCLLFIRTHWVKMNYPELFQQAVNKVLYNRMVR